MNKKNYLTPRVTRERCLSDVGDVYERHAAMRSRLSHIFENPNIAHCESRLAGLLADILKGKVVLDLGCYDGRDTRKLLAYSPSQVVGIDISPVAIDRAREIFGNLAKFYVMDAHQLEFPDETFDVVYGRAILHHLAFKIAIKEICRVLKTGGFAVFIEPLGDNPLWKLFRCLTPKVRTPDETPLSRKQINWADKIFGEQYHFYGGLLSTMFGLISSFTFHRPDNLLLKICDHIDRMLFTTPFKYWARVGYFVWRKKYSLPRD